MRKVSQIFTWQFLCFTSSMSTKLLVSPYQFVEQEHNSEKKVRRKNALRCEQRRFSLFQRKNFEKKTATPLGPLQSERMYWPTGEMLIRRSITERLPIDFRYTGCSFVDSHPRIYCLVKASYFSRKTRAWKAWYFLHLLRKLFRNSCLYLGSKSIVIIRFYICMLP